MNAQIFTIGNETALQLPAASGLENSEPVRLSTVAELLNIIDPPGGKRPYRMLRTTAGHAATCAKLSLKEMPIEMLRDIAPEFLVYLKERRYSPKSASTYIYHLRRLLDHADRLSCPFEKRALREAWEPIAAALKAVTRAPKTVVPFAISQGKHPSVYSDADLESWAAWMARRRRKYRTVRVLKSLFRLTVSRAGLEHLLPKFNCHPGASEYKIRTADMPQPLRSEVQELLAWKQAKFSRGRPQETKLRRESAGVLEGWIGKLFGFAKNVAELTGIRSLQELFTEDVVTAFIEWAVNSRGLTRSSLFRLTMLYGALRHHPNYKDNNYEWFPALLGQLPEDKESIRLERKAKKFLPYDVLCAIPAKIRQVRLKLKARGTNIARLVHHELLIAWLTTLPWRQRNLRQARLGDSESANIFFAPLPTWTHIARPAWVEEALRQNPQQAFWQFRFIEEETKTRRVICGIVPRRLIALLDEYVTQHRPKLVGNNDPGTLFLNEDGGALDRQTTTELVADIVQEYAGKRMPPHLFRDAFAYCWLDEHPEDYLTVSRALWHVNLEYTLKVYGRNFDESNAARRVDDWLSKRSERRQTT